MLFRSIASVQATTYGREIELLMRNDEAKLSKNSFIIKLSPVFHDGLLRVGGRLDNAKVSYDVKHPIILPGKHRLTELLIRGIHEENGHVGVNQVISLLRQRYWITQVTTAVCCSTAFHADDDTRSRAHRRWLRYQQRD